MNLHFSICLHELLFPNHREIPARNRKICSLKYVCLWILPTLHNYRQLNPEPMWVAFSFRCYYRYIKKNDLIRIAFDFFCVSMNFSAIQPQITFIKYALCFISACVVHDTLRIYACILLVVLCVMTSRQQYIFSRHSTNLRFFQLSIVCVFFCCCSFCCDKLWLAAILNANALPCFLHWRWRRGQKKKYFDL